jgi:hypothetical protein
MLNRRDMAALLGAAAAAVPAQAAAQPLPFYASIGPKLTIYSLDVDTAALTRKSDVTLPANVRAYMIAGGAHAPGMTLPACRYPANGLNYTPVVRALLLDLVDWTLGRAAPPPSRWPSLAKGELRRVGDLQAPPGLVWPKVFNQPIAPAGKRGWAQYVPAIDAQGNDLPGIRMPQVAAPLGTYLGWNLRKAGYGEGDLCLIAGSYIPFATAATGDRAVRFNAAIDLLQRDRLLLDEDAARLRENAATAK